MGWGLIIGFYFVGAIALRTSDTVLIYLLYTILGGLVAIACSAVTRSYIMLIFSIALLFGYPLVMYVLGFSMYLE